MRSLFPLLAVFCFVSVTSATDWLTLPSTYSHHAETGERVSQYASITPPTAPAAENFRSSGHTHTRSSMNYGGSSDNYHREEKWGEPVRPYGEWRFPFRPYSTPYPNWGPPYAGLNLGFGIPGYGAGNYGDRGGHRRQPPHDGEAKPGDHQRGPRWHGERERGYLGGGVWPSDRWSSDRWSGDRRSGDRSQPTAIPFSQNPFQPYPAGPGTPYPVAPYYDGYYPTYRQ